jgi:hypothetical protein
MKSYKTLHLNDTDVIKFTFTDTDIHIYITINNINLIRNYNDFNSTLNELQTEYNININSINKINYWFNKNYKKIFPNQIYITKYGRKINKH